MTPLLSARNIAKKFPFQEGYTLKSVSLDLFPGKSICIRGKSGEGKTTLLHILGTLEKPSEGSIAYSFSSSSNSDHDLRCRFIGFVFQSHNLFEDLSLLENVLLPAKILRQNTSKESPLYAQALELIEEVGLTHRLHTAAKKLSGGEKQRTSIARALINNPHLLLADEPSGNLDSETSKEIHHHLLNVAKTRGKGVIVVTHDETLASLCDEIRILRDGVLQ